MFLRKFWSIVGITLLIAACGGGGSSSSTTGGNGTGDGNTTGGGGTTTPGTPQMLDDLITAGGVYSLNAEETGGSTFQLSYAAITGNPANTYLYDVDSKAFTAEAAYNTTYKVLETDGTWTNKTDTGTVGFLKNTDGKFVYESSTGKAELILTQTEDLAGKKMVNFLPYVAMLKTGVTVPENATFPAGSKRAEFNMKYYADTYSFEDDSSQNGVWIYDSVTKGTQQEMPINLNSLISLMSNKSMWIDNYQVHLNGTENNAVTGSYTATFLDNSKTATGTWKKISRGNTELLVLLGGTEASPVFDENMMGGNPFFTFNGGSLYRGYFTAANTTVTMENIIHIGITYGSFNKTAMDAIKDQIQPGGFYGYGTPTNASTLLNDGINYVYSQPIYNTNNGVTGYKLSLDRNIFDGSLAKNENKYTLNFTSKQFLYDLAASQPNGGTQVYLKGSTFSSTTGLPTGTVQTDGSLLLTGNTWNGGEMTTTYNTVDIAGKPIGPYFTLIRDLPYISGGYIDTSKKFSAGAKLISSRFLQKTVAYHVWNGATTGHSTLAELVNGSTVTAWRGQQLKFVFDAVTGTPSSGSLTVKNSDGSVTFGTAIWARKHVGNEDVVVVSGIPASAEKGIVFTDKRLTMFAVYNGQVMAGNEILPGYVIDISSGLVLNKQGIEDLQAAAVAYQ